jgi:hypothetical protein
LKSAAATRRCFEDTRTPSNCNEFVERAPSANHENAEKTGHFVPLSWQRLESPHAFPKLMRLRAMIQNFCRSLSRRFLVADLNVPAALWL